MTQEQIKYKYAVSKGFTDWYSIIRRYALEYIDYEEYSLYENEVMKIYARECLKLASESILKTEYFSKDVLAYIVTNENNIIK